jgi:hypothetical protein
MATMRAIKIPEVLNYILGMLDGDTDAGDLARCARVCQDWEAPALRHLWRERAPPSALFGLLGNLRSLDFVVGTSVISPRRH